MTVDRTDHQYHFTLRARPGDIESALEQIKREGSDPRNIERRNQTRRSYEIGGGIKVAFESATGERTRFIVRTHDISSSGVGFLHGTFVYPGTRCLLYLVTLDKEVIETTGYVMHCKCVQSRVHFIGVKLDQIIDVNQFALAPEEDESDGVDGAIYDVNEILRITEEIQNLAKAGEPLMQLHARYINLGKIIRFRG